MADLGREFPAIEVLPVSEPGSVPVSEPVSVPVEEPVPAGR